MSVSQRGEREREQPHRTRQTKKAIRIRKRREREKEKRKKGSKRDYLRLESGRGVPPFLQGLLRSPSVTSWGGVPP